MGWLAKVFGGSEKLQPISVNDENFKSEILESNVPVLLDVWGPNCAPCQKLAPIIVDIATDYGERLKVAEMNASASPRTMGRLGIRGTPTVVYFDRGREVDRIVGFKGSLYHRDIIDNDILAEAK
ncbi:MAG: thioredoxin fold domain-containing protein [Deltaproteobacteria bacterium]|nr:thioredoxin fold domain-containing protein [Deltaproteobacteria bacterium]